ncbi:MAG: methylated-DNA--[protein]-cysteine S-methyltransferase [Bacteroidota bacterium]|nr:methylated-DNA--[protein]-cysteine S-methyltransferase [Bacteroidota bacterium]
MDEKSFHYQTIAHALEFISSRYGQQPELADIARELHMSPFHFQRLFLRWAGVSPKKFLQYITVTHAKEMLRRNSTTEEAAFESGLSGTSRLHDLFVSIEGVSPGAFKQRGKGVKIAYGFFDSPFGKFLLACAGEKICKIDFIDDEKSALRELKEEWHSAEFTYAPDTLHSLARTIFEGNKKRMPKTTLLVHGTPFQIKVWEALLKIPEGHLTSYDRVAEVIGMPRASRAVGSALAHNPVAYLIPCHRVIKKVGRIGEYRWSSIRKQAMIGWEAARIGER